MESRKEWEKWVDRAEGHVDFLVVTDRFLPHGRKAAHGNKKAESADGSKLAKEGPKLEDTESLKQETLMHVFL